MTHELKNLIKKTLEWQSNNKKTVLATVVKTEGSSYRRPGVRMLINDFGERFGAVSGGCVEKEVQIQAQSVLESGIAKMMAYDGSIRLGCEGIIFVLIEPIFISTELSKIFFKTLNDRKNFLSISYFSSEIESNYRFGTNFLFEKEVYPLRKNFISQENHSTFKQIFTPLFRCFIFGAEYDAVVLCKSAAELGWEITIVAPPDEQKSIKYFSGAQNLLTPNFSDLKIDRVDNQTAIILMTHSLTKDLQYLMALSETNPAYFGLLGPTKRKEQLINHLLDRKPDTSLEFIEKLKGPVGIHIGAESAEEISVSILAEILSVIRNKEPFSLNDKKGKIHE